MPFMVDKNTVPMIRKNIQHTFKQYTSSSLLLLDKARFSTTILITSARSCKFYKERLHLEYALNWTEFYTTTTEKSEWYSLQRIIYLNMK